MPRITMALEPTDVDAMREVLDTLLGVAADPGDQHARECADSVRAQLDSADPGVLLALGDQAVALLLLVQNAIERRGGVEVLAEATVRSGKAVWANATTEA